MRKSRLGRSSRQSPDLTLTLESGCATTRRLCLWNHIRPYLQEGRGRSRVPLILDLGRCQPPFPGGAGEQTGPESRPGPPLLRAEASGPSRPPHSVSTPGGLGLAAQPTAQVAEVPEAGLPGCGQSEVQRCHAPSRRAQLCASVVARNAPPGPGPLRPLGPAVLGRRGRGPTPLGGGMTRCAADPDGPARLRWGATTPESR